MCGTNAMRKCWQEVSSSWSQGLDAGVYPDGGPEVHKRKWDPTPPPPSSHKLIKQNIKLKVLSSENIYRGLKVVPVV